MLQRAIGAVVGLASVLSFKSTAQNDTIKKRSFYEDDKQTIPVPGTITPLDTQASEKMSQQYVLEGVTVRTTSLVQDSIRKARESVVGAYACAENWLNNNKSKYIELERSVTNTFSELHDKREDLLPNSIYIIVAGLSGNIIARNRGPVTRFIVPTVLGLASFKYFLPHTFSNTFGLLWKVEQRTLPQIAEQQASAYEKATSLVKGVEQTAVLSLAKVSLGIDSARKTLASAAGLSIDEEVTKK